MPLMGRTNVQGVTKLAHQYLCHVNSNITTRFRVYRTIVLMEQVMMKRPEFFCVQAKGNGRAQREARSRAGDFARHEPYG